MEHSNFAPDAALHNDNSEHRQALIAALVERGLDAYEYGSGGGWQHVCVYLFSEDGNWLAIATGSMETECEIGLMGDRDQYQVGDEFPIKPRTLADATDGFQHYWDERDRWVQTYRAGLLDYK